MEIGDHIEPTSEKQSIEDIPTVESIPPDTTEEIGTVEQLSTESKHRIDALVSTKRKKAKRIPF